MLSKREKAEMLEDGQSIKRKREFAKLKNKHKEDQCLLDKYIQFLMTIQKVFKFSVNSRNVTISKLNKL